MSSFKNLIFQTGWSAGNWTFLLFFLLLWMFCLFDLNATKSNLFTNDSSSLQSCCITMRLWGIQIWFLKLIFTTFFGQASYFIWSKELELFGWGFLNAFWSLGSFSLCSLINRIGVNVHFITRFLHNLKCFWHVLLCCCLVRSINLIGFMDV